MGAPDTKAKIFIGPAGWSYADWVGPVYPQGKKVDELLTIARYFNCIELNSSFYRVPSRYLVSRWADRLEGTRDFKFTVKVWQRFTHEMKGSREEAESFVHVFDPLLERGRVGAFLLQFPWSFSNEPDKRSFLETLAGWFRGWTTAVELRHASWNVPEALSFLSASGLSLCNIDQPVIGKSMPPTEAATNPHLGYIRLHGRNYHDWFRKDAGRDARYDYLYRQSELEEWKGRAERLAREVEELYIITNNHYRGQALVNAFQVRSLLEAQRQDIPDALVAAYPVLGEIAEKRPTQGNLL